MESIVSLLTLWETSSLYTFYCFWYLEIFGKRNGLGNGYNSEDFLSLTYPLSSFEELTEIKTEMSQTH